MNADFEDEVAVHCSELRRCVSARMLAAHASDCDAWYQIWHPAAGKTPASFAKIQVSEEGGAFKLDEN